MPWLAAAFCLLLAAVSTAAAQPDDAARWTRFQHLDSEDGLPQAQGYWIYQDSLGFMWFATGDGLARYDGQHLEVFRHERGAPNTLAGNSITAVVEGSHGYLWIGTRSGLSRFDRKTGHFTNFRHDANDAGSLAHDDVRTIVEDDEGRLWIGTYGGGMDRFDRSTGDFIHHRHDPDDPNTPGSNRIFNLLVAPDGRLWISALGSGVDRFDPDTGSFEHYRADPSDPGSLSHPDVWDLHLNDQGRLWAGTDAGLDRLRPDGEFEHFRHDPSDTESLSHDVVNAIARAPGGDLWVGTNDGLNLLDTDTGRFRRFFNDPGNAEDLSDDMIWSLFVDREGSLWIGTMYGGINRLTPLALNFANFSSSPTRSRSLSHDTVYGIERGSDGRLYVGTHGGGLNVKSPGRPGFDHYRHDPRNPESLSNDIIWDITPAQDGKLWIGTYGGGLNRLDPATGRFEHFRHDATDPTSISHDDVRTVFRDSHGEIWVSTRAGLNRFDPGTGAFQSFRHDPIDPESLSHDWTTEIIEDRRGNLWVATYDGLDRFNRETGGFEHYRHEPGNPDSLAGDRVIDVFEDSRGRLWACVIDGGLNRLDLEDGKWLHYGTNDGLPDDTVVGIQEDGDGNLWLATEAGLSRFDPETGDFTNFDTDDGLASNVFNDFGVHRDPDGTMYFGTRNGITAFLPGEISTLANEHVTQPNAMLTGIELVGGETRPEEVLDQRPPFSKSLTLSPNHTVFTLSFAAPDFVHAGQLRYAYRLQGFESQWRTTGTDRPYATYTNLDPGNYRFQVRSGVAGGWSDDPAELEITVLPPLWRTWWAYALYAAAAVLLVVWFVANQRRKLAYERDVNIRLQEADRVKNEFLANTSHELRTPIHGIIGIAESLREGVSGTLPEAARRHLAMIVGSGRRLAALINDILDFSQLRNRTLHLDRRPVDLHSVVQTVLDLTRPLIRDRDLELINAVPADLPAVDADEDRLSQIFHNLVGNAVKFTPDGRITVSAQAKDEEIEVRVSDTGIGIPESQQQSIFNAFHQEESGRDRPYPGSGLGLAITRQLVELHGGRISVDSKEGGGSTFRFTLTAARQPPRARPQTRESVARPIGSVEATTNTPNPGQSGHRILVVDDDTVNRQVLVNYLTLAGYGILEAAGGEQALEVVETDRPDLLLLDLTMPGQSGIDVCKRVRERHSLQDLPVIFITADHRQSEMTAGFQVGANDYLTKPMTRDELLARVRLHLELKDAHGNLESTVQSRTRELEEKNVKLEEARRSLEEASLTDPLTELRNRRFLVRFIESDVRIAVRAALDRNKAPESRPGDLVFFLMDLDDFKSINDRFGHQAGDEALVQIRGLLQGVFRASDYLVRWGGEEFLGVARFVHRDSAAAMAERLRRSLAENPFRIHRQEAIYMTWSVGFATFPFLPESPESLSWAQVVSIADHAQYAAKRLGGNGWVGLHAGRVTDPDTLFQRLLDDTAGLVDRGELRVESSHPADNPFSKARA